MAPSRSARRLRLVAAFSLLAVSLAAVPPSGAETPSAADRTLVPERRAGAITMAATRADLVRLYGEANVKETRIGIGEGETVPGVVLFEDTADELLIRWKDEGPGILHVQVRRPDSAWRTDTGIGIGTSLEEVARINGRDFRLLGLGWDYGGRSVKWMGGVLADGLTLDFVETRDIPEADYRKILGDGEFPASHPSFRASRMRVVGIIVSLE